MTRIAINADWKLTFEHDGIQREIPASVPGDAHLDLVEAGILQDPYFGDNVHELVNWENTRWIYRTRIEIPRVSADEQISIRFDGIDTIARVRIADLPEVRSRNMFVPVTVDATGISGSVVDVEVEIESVIAYAWNRKRPVSAGAPKYNYESLPVRKARHSYGWDIGPRIVTAGIWREVVFEIHKTHEIEDPYISTLSAGPKLAVVGVDWFVNMPVASRGTELHLSVADASGNTVATSRITVRFPTGKEKVTIENPRLWWPRGYGEPHLYTLVSELVVDGRVLDTRQTEFGIRTIELQREDAIDGRAKQFRFVVNGTPVFVKGSNWVPADAFHSLGTSKVETNLKPYIESECNMLRIWGGGIYEDSSLFTRCDRAGIMIWQDFMFACELPAVDPEYLAEVEAEIREVVCRYRNHPSLAIWCGDNENDAAYREWNGVRYDENEISRNVIPRILHAHDPYRPYLPSSPYISRPAWEASVREDRPLSSIVPEQHLWGPRDAYKGDFYRRNTAVFVSEIGYHGCPSVGSIAKFLDESAMDRNTAAGRAQWTTHAAQPYGDEDGNYAYRTGLMENQVSMLFGDIPDDLDLFSRASQISQAEAFKYFIEHFRIRKGEKTGIIWWNMQDMWPQFSDAVIDYYGEKKLAWEYIRRSQQPVCIAVDEAAGWVREIIALNDTRCDITGTYRVTSSDGTVSVADTPFTVPANATAKIGEVRYTDTIHRVIRVTWECAPVGIVPPGAAPDERTGTNHYLCGEPPFHLDTYVGSWLPFIFSGESER